MAQANKRIHTRKTLQAEGWIAVPPAGGWDPIRTTDVATGGFAFVSQEPLAVDVTRKFRLQLPNNGGFMHVEGRIAYCLELTEAPGFRVGVQAISVDVVDIAAILAPARTPQADAKLDLSIQRTVDLQREKIWAAWTTPALLKQWFCPQPWKTVECDIDLRPGGSFRTVMQGPQGERLENLGTYLEVVENEKLVWTNALLPGFRPAPAAPTPNAPVEFKFTAFITLEANGASTNYTATVLHSDEAARNQHLSMGFDEGWNIALDQLVALVKQS